MPQGLMIGDVFVFSLFNSIVLTGLNAWPASFWEPY